MVAELRDQQVREETGRSNGSVDDMRYNRRLLQRLALRTCQFATDVSLD